MRAAGDISVAALCSSSHSGVMTFGPIFRRDRENLNVLGRELSSDVVERQPVGGLAGPRRDAGGIVRQAQAAVLPVGEQQDGLASGAAGKKFAGGEIDRFVDVRAAGVAQEGAHIDARDGAANLLAHVGKRKLQIGVRGEIHDGGLVERRERVDQRVGRLLHLFGIAQHAGAGVNDERDAGGRGRSVEVGNRLRDAVFENAEIFATQAPAGRRRPRPKRCRLREPFA